MIITYLLYIADIINQTIIMEFNEQAKELISKAKKAINENNKKMYIDLISGQDQASIDWDETDDEVWDGWNKVVNEGLKKFQL